MNFTPLGNEPSAHIWTWSINCDKSHCGRRIHWFTANTKSWTKRTICMMRTILPFRFGNQGIVFFATACCSITELLNSLFLLWICQCKLSRQLHSACHVQKQNESIINDRWGLSIHVVEYQTLFVISVICGYWQIIINVTSCSLLLEQERNSISNQIAALELIWAEIVSNELILADDFLCAGNIFWSPSFETLSNSSCDIEYSLVNTQLFCHFPDRNWNNKFCVNVNKNEGGGSGGHMKTWQNLSVAENFEHNGANGIVCCCCCFLV